MKKRKNKINKFNLNEFVYGNFKLSLSYIKTIKNYIWFSTALFLFVGLISFFFPVFFEEQILIN